MKRRALDLLQRLPADTTFLPVLVLGELYHLLLRKAGRSVPAIRTAILAWQDSFALIETSPSVMLSAVDLASHHQLRIWDAVTLSAASAAGCRLLLSEELQSGFTWNGVTVTNPFAVPQHELLIALLGEDLQ